MTHYHDYETVKETKDGILEVCKECKHRNIIKKSKSGRIDNESYLKEHVRDTAQPGGATKKIFNKYYGKKAD